MSETPPTRPMSRPGEVSLSRDLSLFTITMIGVGGMIGAGIFVLTGSAAGEAGPALILAFLLNGLVTSFTAMSYAELGSTFPGAGGGYPWVKEALGGVQGFVSGWMDWFAHSVAGSLYALAFGSFASALLAKMGVSTFGLPPERFALILTTMIIAVFVYINYLGASETGTIGNVVTVTKVAILALFVLFGLVAMAHTEFWVTRFTTESGFMPKGAFGVLVAMGLTFIAFEGYEIIAQSGEEVIDPKRNIPRAIFISIGIAVLVYVFVGVSAIGAVQPPEGLKAYQFLGQQKEIAIIDVAQQTFPWGIGAVVLLLSGLASTMSALNATTYSSSRVSFAMGRDLNLPRFFSRIHPKKNTPYLAIIGSGTLMLIMAWLLPLEDVAAAGDIMFLLLFLQVNVAVMVLRRKHPDLERGFSIPWFPVLPVLAIVSNGFLALYLFTFSPIAWYFAIGWLTIGLLSYLAYFSRVEEQEKPKEILLEEVLVSREYSVLVPVADDTQAEELGALGSLFAKSRGGELLALNVIEVPPQLTLGEGRLFLKEGRGYLEGVIEQAKAHEVPVHTVIRLGRNAAEALRKTAYENASDLILLGWQEHDQSGGRLFGSLIDPIVDNPPTDVVVCRLREQRPVKCILVPVSGGRNSRLATRLAVDLARAYGGDPRVCVIHIVSEQAINGDRVRARQVLDYVVEGIDYPNIETRLVEGQDVAETILDQAEQSDLVVIGATEEPVFRNFLVGTLPEKIARRATASVLVVKRRSSRLHSAVRQTILEPTEPKPLD